MPKHCTICEKKYSFAWRIVKLRGKYNPTIKLKKRPNLQWVRIPLGNQAPAYKEFAGKRIIACTKCIKALSKGNSQKLKTKTPEKTTTPTKSGVAK
ncbi:MAG: hypothetical protein PHF44_03055 [Candidatus Pacebacteria bacterium]|nr:hypothetical protein [Candidatus Paceibacterota bacterium]